MNFSETFIRRPVATTLIMSGILIFGSISFRLLSVNDLPTVDFPVILVSAALPGASPETMASAVATPLERQFSTIAGLDSMSSNSSLGATQITLMFNLSRSIDAAAQDVQAAIAQAQRQMPQDMPSPPTYLKFNPADQPILYIALTSSSMPLSTLDEYGETLMAQRISTVSGVAQVQVFGAQKYAVRVQLSPEALASRQIGIDEVANAIRSGNVNLPTGILYGQHKAFTVETAGQLTDAKSYLPLVVAYRNGAPVRLSEIGTATDSVENNKIYAWYCDRHSQRRAIILAVQRQPGTNTVEVARAVNQLLPTFHAQLPASIAIETMFDRSLSIKESVDDVEFTLVLTLALVVMVIFLFLRNVSATIIPSLTLPMSVIGTFAVMYAFGYSLDNLSLMALTLSVGFVVDDAIVMLENIVRHMEMGKPALRAALEGSKEIGFTIISMTLSLAAVFIPFLLMGGLIGRLFREFSVTIGVAVLVSGFISLTLTPMLSSRFIRDPHKVHHGKIYWASEKFFEGLTKAYGWALRAVLNQRWATAIVLVATLYGTVKLFKALPQAFLPAEDRGFIFGFTEAAEGISYSSMAEHQMAVNHVLQQDPDVDIFMSTTMTRGVGANNQGITFIRLQPRAESEIHRLAREALSYVGIHLDPGGPRTAAPEQVIENLRPKLAAVPGMHVFLQNPPPIPIGGRLTKSQYQYSLQGPDLDELYACAGTLEKKIRELPGVVDVTSDLQIKNPQVSMTIDRDKASSYNVSADQIENGLYYAYGSRQVSTIFTPTNQYQVIMELAPQYQLDANALAMLYIRSSKGQLVPLSAVTEMATDLGPLSINHTGQLPSVTLSFNLKPGYAIGDAAKQVEAVAAAVLPRTISGSFQGTAQAFQQSMGNMLLLLISAIVVIYLVLGILYESFVHPLTIISAVPFAAFGAFATLLLFGSQLSLYAYVGVIMLVGLVKKNGIIMVDFAIEARRQGKSPKDAIHEACMVRFRPITMTTVAALMAALPIALGYGAGGESRRPLGLAVVGGLLFSQTLTLFVTPVIYTWFEWLSGLFRRREAAVEAADLGPALDLEPGAIPGAVPMTLNETIGETISPAQPELEIVDSSGRGADNGQLEADRPEGPKEFSRARKPPV